VFTYAKGCPLETFFPQQLSGYLAKQTAPKEKNGSSFKLSYKMQEIILKVIE